MANDESTETARDSSSESGEGTGPAHVMQANLNIVELDKIDLDDETFRFRASLRIGDLKRSIQENGLQVPVILRGGRGRGKYQVISGFRRLTALSELGVEEVPAVVRRDLDEDEDGAYRASVLENTARKTYSDIDRAHVARRLRERGYTVEQAGEVMNLTRRQVTNIESLLDLPEAVQEAVDDPDQRFSATHALTLRKLKKKYPPLEYEPWIDLINKEEMSVAQLTRAVNKEYRTDDPPEFESIFQNGTNASKGVFRFAPVKVEVKQLSADEKKRLKGELEKLLKKLG